MDGPGGVEKRRSSSRIQEAKMKKISKIRDVIMEELSEKQTIPNRVKRPIKNEIISPEQYQKLNEAMFNAYDVLDHFLSIDVSYADTIKLLTSQKITNENMNSLMKHIRTKWGLLLENTKTERTVLYALTNKYSDWFDNNFSLQTVDMTTDLRKILRASKELKSKLWEHHYRIKKYLGVEPTLDSILVSNITLADYRTPHVSEDINSTIAKYTEEEDPDDLIVQLLSGIKLGGKNHKNTKSIRNTNGKQKKSEVQKLNPIPKRAHARGKAAST